MKILHVPFHFYPDAVGGTEVYALSLAQHLQQLGHDATIAAPGERQDGYTHDGIQTYRFEVGRTSDVAALYGAGDELAAVQFENILDKTEPNVVHLHGMSPAISVRLLDRIRQRAIPVVFTVHIPGIVCSRGTLLEHGTTVCDGAVRVRRCSRCVLEAKGMPRVLAQMIGYTPSSIGSFIAMSGLQSSAATVLRMTDLQTLRQAMLKRFLADTDHIVVVSEWLRQTLLRNEISGDKITLCRHGVTQIEVPRTPAAAPNQRPAKRIAYIGRLTEDKGARILVEALLRVPELPLNLDIYGIVQDEPSRTYAERLRKASECDQRIRFLPPIPNVNVPLKLKEYDALAIPSQVMETGPLTVYDAFAAGIPVIGSKRGGIQELVTDDRNGLLVEPGDTSSWARTLIRICEEKDLIGRLRRGIPALRTMRHVAIEMAELYQKLERSAGKSSFASRGVVTAVAEN